MRRIEDFEHQEIPKIRKTEFTKEEQLDILNFYLQYKPLFENEVNQDNISLEKAASDFTELLYVYGIVDLDYFENLDIIKEKYGVESIECLAKEKLNFLEILTIFTFIHRAERFSPGWYEDCIKDKTYINLLSRMEEIKNEL